MQDYLNLCCFLIFSIDRYVINYTKWAVTGNASRGAIAPNEFRKHIHRHTAQNIWIRKLRVFVGADITKLP